MIKIIVDTNIIFSTLLNINSRIGQIIINGVPYFDFISPEYIRAEIFTHRKKIQEIAKLNDEEFIETYELIMRNITILNNTTVPVQYYKEAFKLCEDIDADDTVFVAFAMFMECKLWTGDKKLYNGLLTKGFDQLISTPDLYDEFIKMNSKWH